MKEIRLEIVKNKTIAENTYEMQFSCDKNDSKVIHAVTPGQFMNIKIDTLFLRRPISICDVTEKDLTIVYKVVGKGTEILSTYVKGKTVDVLMPLGNGYDTLRSGESPLLIGGGAGVPPMYYLCRVLADEGKRPKVLLGFNSASETFYEDKFKGLGADVMVTTVDGSCGRKGFVTDALPGVSYTYLYACGPEAMLKAVDSVADENTGGQYSFEERMGCGFGACMGCSRETENGAKRICREGPVFERSEVVWKE